MRQYSIQNPLLLSGHNIYFKGMVQRPLEASLYRYEDHISFLNIPSSSRGCGVLILVNPLLCPRTYRLPVNIMPNNTCRGYIRVHRSVSYHVVCCELCPMG